MKRAAVLNDFKRNKAINLTLFLFVMFSAVLSAASVLLAVQTIISIGKLYETAQPPHFLQMHKGEIDEDKVNKFMAENDLVTYSQIIALINIYGENLTVVGEKGTYDLSDLRLDIGLVKQNKDKDLLLNSNHEKVILNKGEIGIPVILKGMYDMKIGNKVIMEAGGIHKEFVIKEFILDAQMNSTMASSTRVLLSDEDYKDLFKKAGETEYIIEAYFNDKDYASAFQTAYENAGLPINGQAVTYAMIFLLSALTDLITVFVLIMAAVLLIIVSFICIKYTIMAALEEDVREIGTMKAIGLGFADIRGIYLIKYRILAATGVIAGYIIALMSGNLMTRHIDTTFGKSGMSGLTVIMSAAASCLVYILINIYCRKILKKIKKLTVVDALVSGKGFEKETGKVRDGLYRSKKVPVNWLIGFREVFYRFRNWMIVFMVVLIAVLMSLIPVNLLTTFEAPEFVTYMGCVPGDILIEVESGKNLEVNYAKVRKLLAMDDSVKDAFEYRTVRAKTTDSTGNLMNIDIDAGIGAGDKLRYLSGKAPQGDDEIAISYLNSREMGIEAGDSIDLLIGENVRQFRVSGIYQDLTGGGKTAKSVYNFPELAAHKYSFVVNLRENTDPKNKADEWAKIFGAGVSADPMEEFLDQTLGQISRQLKAMVFAVFSVGVLLVMLIMVLFLKLRLAKDLSDIAILKAIGFSMRDLCKQYMIKVGLTSLTGILAGITAANLFGEKIINVAMGIAGLGVKEICLITNPVIEYLIVPLLFMGAIMPVTRFIIRSIKKYNIVSVIND